MEHPATLPTTPGKSQRRQRSDLPREKLGLYFYVLQLRVERSGLLHRQILDL